MNGVVRENGAQGELALFLSLSIIVSALEFAKAHIFLGPPYAGA